MDLTSFGRLSDWLPYTGVMLAAIVEGDVAYIAAATLVAQGQLNPAGVLVAGALGAATGDQLYFYAFRGRLSRWLARYPSLDRRVAPLVERARQHDSVMVLLIRFAPGLRIAIAGACAAVGVSPLKFSVLNLLSAFAWALALLGIVGWFGPTYLVRFGLGRWEGAVVIGLVVLGLMKVFGAWERRSMEGSSL